MGLYKFMAYLLRQNILTGVCAVRFQTTGTKGRNCMKLCDHPLRACNGPWNMQTECDKESQYVPSTLCDQQGDGWVLSRWCIVRCKKEDSFVRLDSMTIIISLKLQRLDLFRI